MSKINLKKSDKKMTSFEVFKQTFTIVSVISIFDVMFYIMYIQEGTIIPLIACGLPLTLIMIAILPQFIMHFLGVGQMVITSDNQMILRTSSSGKGKSSKFAPLARIFTFPAAFFFMRKADKDGDGKLSWDEVMDSCFTEYPGDAKPWEWDFKKAYKFISKEFDLPPNNDPISFEDFVEYTGDPDESDFDILDSDNDGLITKEQFVDFFWNDMKSEIALMKEYFVECDIDGDGLLSRSELEKFANTGAMNNNWAKDKPDFWWMSNEED